MNTSAFLTTLFTMTTAATVAAVAVMILRLPLKKAPRWITCALWLAVLVRMVCPVGFSAPVSVTGQVTQRIPVPQAYEHVQAITDPVAEPTPTATTPQTTQVVAPDPVPETSTLSAETVLFALWAAGAIAMAGWALISYLRLRYRVADAVLVQGKVYETDRVESPFLCGFLRPRIYLPVGVSDHDRHYVLLHEEAHLRRRDHLTKPLAWLALCIHWFNPVLWLAYWLYGRDVETACDQAVVSDFDRSDTAGYAAALLHLGRKTALPHAIPLAFGEENAKGRVGHILRYQRLGGWAVSILAMLAIAALLLLLADFNDRGQMEWVPIQRASAPAQGDIVPLPEDMREELVSLLNKHGHGAYTVTHPYPSQWENVKLASNQSSFSFNPETLTLVKDRGSRGDIMDPLLMAQVNESITQDEAYIAWLERYADFQRHGRADAFYAVRVSDMADEAAIETLLETFTFSNTIGEYTVESDPAAAVLQIHLHGTPAFQADRQNMQDYLEIMGTLTLAAVDNAQGIAFTHDTVRNPFHYTVQADTKNKDLTREEFRDLYDQVWTKAPPFLYRQYHTPKPVYVSKKILPRPTAALLYGDCTVAPNLFSAYFQYGKDGNIRIFDSYPDVWYQTASDFEPITDPDGAVLLAPDGYQSIEAVSVMDAENQYTGYTMFQLDGEIWLAYYSDPNALGYLVQFDPSDT